MSGGGSSGQVGFPDYIETWHEGSLGAADPSTTSGFVELDSAMANAFQNNPYTSVSAAGTSHVEGVVDDWGTDVQSVINNLDDQTDWQDRVDTAVSKIITNDVLDNLDPHTNLAGDAESGADTNITKAKGAIDTGINEETDWESFVDTVVAKLDAKLNDADVDLGAIETSIRTASDSEISDALVAALDQVGVSVETDWGSYADTVKAKADSAGFFSDASVDLSSVETAIRTATDSEIADALTAALDQVGVDPEADWGSLADKVQTKVDSTGFLSDASVDLSSIETSVRGATDSEITDALAAALNQVGVSPNSDWAAKIDEAITKVDNASVLEDIDIAAAIAAAESDASSEVDEAITKAESLVNSSLIDPVVNEFEQKAQNRLNQRKRSVSSFYADVNAVHSSGFLISQALLERDKQREVNEFDSETRLELFREAFQGHLQTFQANLQSLAQEQIQESQQRLEFITQGAQAMAQILSQKVQFEQAVTQLHAQGYGERMGQENQNRTETETLNKQSRDQILNQQIDRITDILLRKIGFEEAVTQSHVQSYGQRMGQENQNRTETETLNKQTRDQFITQQMDTIVQILSDKLGFEQSVVRDHVQAYSQRMQQENQNRVEMESLNKQSRDQLIGQQTNTISEILANKMQYEQTFMQLHLEAFRTRLENYLRAEARNKQSDDKMVQSGTSGMLQTSRTDAQLTVDERRAFAEAAVSGFQVRQSAEEYELSLDEKSSLWDLKVHEMGGNVLAAPGGMSARTPTQKSEASKAIGGALTGAATGAAAGSFFPGPGTAIGAGVGAILGGVAPLL